MAEKEGGEGDVYFSGELSYKSGTWTSSQRYMAQLRFESASGLKRLDLYPVNGNRRLPGSPSTTIPLTHALGAISGKHHAITRAKHTFLIITPRERYQLSARSEDEKQTWLKNIDLILNHMPLDTRTHEFHVTISPTTHSDNLQLNGQYVLKVTETELHLFSASGFLASKFWTPLTSIRKAQHYVLPTSIPHHQVGGHGVGAGESRNSTQRLLIITTEMTAPVGEGGFAFFSDSAKDIAATITLRRDTRLLARSMDTATHPPLATPVEEHKEEEERYIETTKQHKNQKSMKSLPQNSSCEEEQDSSSSPSEKKEFFDKHRQQSSFQRKCARKNRVIPMSHKLEKERSQLRLKFSESGKKDSLTTPDEPYYITNTDLASPQRKFHEWKRQRNEMKERSRTSPSPLSIESRRGLNWTKERSSTVSTPDREDNNRISDMSSMDGEYVTICPITAIHRVPWYEEGEDSRASVSSTTSQGKMRGLERQTKIDILTPTSEPDFTGIRPRTNAMSELENPSSIYIRPNQHRLVMKQQSLDSKVNENRHGGGEKEWLCNGDACMLVPRPPTLASTLQKSSSDPQLSNRRSYDLTTSVQYLEIIPPTTKPMPPTKRAPKKPKPTPRTHKQPPANLPTHDTSFLTTPPTPTSRYCKAPLPSSPSFDKGLDVQVLLSSQRSLSESNIYSSCGESLDDEYVDMSYYTHQQPHHAHSEDTSTHYNVSHMDTLLYNHGDEVTLRQPAMRRQISRSMGNIPATINDTCQPLYENARGCTASFLETEDIYENGTHVMNFFLYGNVSTEQNDEEIYSNATTDRQIHRNAVAEHGCYGDSGLGSTPSCSPLLGKSARSFSLDDVRQTDTDTQQRMTKPTAYNDCNQHTAAVHEHIRPEHHKPVRYNRPCIWQLPSCTKAIRGQDNHVIHKAQNLPLITSS